GKGGELGSMARDARDGVERIRGVVRALATFARSQPDEVALLPVDRVLELAIGITCGLMTPRVDVVRHFAPLPMLRANETRLAPAFGGWLAIAAQAEVRQIVVTTRVDTADWAIVELRYDGARHQFGPLDDPSAHAVALCRTILRPLGGSVTYIADPHGTTFR